MKKLLFSLSMVILLCACQYSTETGNETGNETDTETGNEIEIETGTSADGFNWNKDDSGRLTVIGYVGTSGSITIPDEINEVPVTSIGNYAFADKELTSVIIPDSVISIGDGAFEGNPLISISIGANVSLGDFVLGNNAGFNEAYTDAGKQAGIYIRLNALSTTWTWFDSLAPVTDFEWEADNYGGIIITGYVGTSNAVLIPEEIDGIPVTAIGDEAFQEKI